MAEQISIFFIAFSHEPLKNIKSLDNHEWEYELEEL